MKLNVVIFCLLFCDFSIIAKSEGNECPEKRGGSNVGENPTVQGYVEEKIEEGFAKVSLETVIFPVYLIT